MQYSIYINQKKANEWELTPQQSILFSFLYELPSWANCHIICGVPYYYITKRKIVSELPLLSSKPDTIYRWIKKLSELGLIRIVQHGSASLIGITQKGAEWNRDVPSVPKGTHLGCTSEGSDSNPRVPGWGSDSTSDVHPTNHYTNNHNPKPNHHSVISAPNHGDDKLEIDEYLELVVKPVSESKKNPDGYIKSAQVRIMQNGLSNTDLAQLAAVKSKFFKNIIHSPHHQPQPTIPSELWDNAIETLIKTVGENDFNLWIAPLRCLRDDAIIELAGPDRFFCAHIKAHFLEQINEALSGREVLIRPEI